MDNFSLSEDVIRSILDNAKPFGHNEVIAELNLGFGFLYYGVVRAIRPKHILVIGSGYGFSVVCLALGLRDNKAGTLTFVDPSYSLLSDGPIKTIGGRGTWKNPELVRQHFSSFGVDHIVSHYKMTNDEFFPKYRDLDLPPIDLAFIDGSHTFDNVSYDFAQVLKNSSKHSYIFLHDTNIYIREFLRHSGVKRFLKMIKQDENFEVIDFPFSSGVALVRVLEPKKWSHQENFSLQ